MSIGSLRRRLPVAAKTALTTAGAIVAVPGSPMPPGASPLGTMCTSTFGRLVDAQDLVGVEVALLDAAVLERDLPVQGCGQPVHDAALHLRVTVSGLTTVPQSTAQTTRSTRTLPSSATATSATWAT